MSEGGNAGDGAQQLPAAGQGRPIDRAVYLMRLRQLTRTASLELNQEMRDNSMSRVSPRRSSCGLPVPQLSPTVKALHIHPGCVHGRRRTSKLSIYKHQGQWYLHRPYSIRKDVVLWYHSGRRMQTMSSLNDDFARNFLSSGNFWVHISRDVEGGIGRCIPSGHQSPPSLT